MSGIRLASEIVVLLVGNHEILKSLLQQEGFCVLTAATCQEALDLLQQFTDRIILITNIDSGELKGIELYERIRKVRPQTQALFIVSKLHRLRESLPGTQVLEEGFGAVEFLNKLKAMLTSNPL